MSEQIYRRPDDYDLEHEGDTEDIDFFVRLAARLKPQRVLELAAGSGRVTLPLAEAGAREGFEVVGLEIVPEMLAEANRCRDAAPESVRERLTFVLGDMRSWKARAPFDLIVTPCSSMSHVLGLDEQLATWRQARENLNPGGRFVVDVSTPDVASFADSARTPTRALVEIDRDTTDPETGARMLRFKTTRYLAHEQRAQIRYLYDKFTAAAQPDRYVSDYENHVYYPRELRLLFLHTGFEIEAVYGDYRERPLGPTSRQMIVIGKKPD